MTQTYRGAPHYGHGVTAQRLKRELRKHDRESGKRERQRLGRHQAREQQELLRGARRSPRASSSPPTADEHPHERGERELLNCDQPGTLCELQPLPTGVEVQYTRSEGEQRWQVP